MLCAKTHSCRDFVDYDSNLIAVAHGIGGVEQGKAVLKRIDTGIQKCTALQVRYHAVGPASLSCE